MDANTGSSFNRYAYTNNSPYKYLDKDGRNPALVLGAEGAEIGTMVLPGWGTAIGGVVGAGLGWYLGDKAVQWIASASSGDENGNKINAPMGAQSASGGALPPDDNNKGAGEKSRSKPPDALKDAEGRPHSIVEKRGRDGQYTTHNGDGTWKQYRGSGQDHGVFHGRM